MRKVIGTSESLLDIVFRNNQPEAATAGGSVLNAMVSTARAGLDTTLVSYVGDDYVGREIIGFLQKNGVFIENITQCHGMKSPISIAHLNAQGDAEYSFYHDTATPRIDITFPEIKKDDILLIGSFFSVDGKTRPSIHKLLDCARKNGAVIIYDLNFRPAHRKDLPQVKANILENMEYSDIIKASRDDIKEVFGTDCPQAVYDSHIKGKGKPLICTNGAKAVRLIGNAGAELSYDVPAVDVVSTIGAGDNFNAGLIYGLIREGVSREQLCKGLDNSTWERLIACAMEFSSACCKETFNYVPQDFGESKRQELERKQKKA